MIDQCLTSVLLLFSLLFNLYHHKTIFDARTYSSSRQRIKAYTIETSTIRGKIKLAWAMPVDDVQLAARLEAYVKTKAPVTTLQLCITHAVSHPISNLPPEVVTMVTDHLKQMVYQEKIRDCNALGPCQLTTQLHVRGKPEET